MRDARTRDGSWTRDAAVFVPGTTDEFNWAILEVAPLHVPFYIGWINKYSTTTERYSEVVQTLDGLVAMDVHEEAVTFVVQPADRITQLHVRLVKKVAEDDAAYANVPHY